MHGPVTHYLPNPLVQTGQITAVKLMQIWDKIVSWYSAQMAGMITPVISTCHRGCLGNYDMLSELCYSVYIFIVWSFLFYPFFQKTALYQNGIAFSDICQCNFCVNCINYTRFWIRPVIFHIVKSDTRLSGIVISLIWATYLNLFALSVNQSVGLPESVAS